MYFSTTNRTSMRRSRALASKRMLLPHMHEWLKPGKVKSRPISLSLLGVVALTACELSLAPAQGDPPELDHALYAPVSLTGVVLHDSELLKLPTRIEWVEDQLVVLDIASDSIIHVLSASTGNHLRSFGRKGEGPGELLGPWSIDSAPQELGAIWVFDLSLHRLTRFPLDDEVPQAKNGSQLELLRLRSDVTLLDPIWVDSTIITLGFFRSGRLGLFARDGRLLDTKGLVPTLNVLMPGELTQHAFQSRLAANPSRTRLAVASRHSDRMEVYTDGGVLLHVAEPPFAFLPRAATRHRAGRLEMITGEDLRFGYLDLAATEERIFALFSGRTRRGFPGQANFGRYIHVYDWSGTLVEVLRLPLPAIALSVDPRGAFIFAMHHDPEPTIGRYEYLASYCEVHREASQC